MILNDIIIAAFFCYGMYTLQRSGFLLDWLPKIWKRLPVGLHEPLFSCGVCVSSLWGIFFLVSNWYINTYVGESVQYIFRVPLFLVAVCGICAVLDRAIKSFEYNYRYNPIKPLSNYSYLEDVNFRHKFTGCFLSAIHGTETKIVEIGGFTEDLSYTFGNAYVSYDKFKGDDVICSYLNKDYFIVIHGLAFEGNFDYLLSLLHSAKGFVIEGSLAGESLRQLNWITDNFKGLIRLPYVINDCSGAPEHCGGNVSNRVVLVKEYKA